MEIEKLMEWSYRISREKGFWDKERNKAEMIALMHSELSEALEELRKPASKFDKLYHTIDKEGEYKPEGLVVELADTMIRIADFCRGFDLPLETALVAKLRYNECREPMHGKLF